MPIYYFDTDDGETKFRDEVGIELDNDQVARDEASRALTAIAQEYVPSDLPERNITMWVRDGAGEPLLHLALSFAIRQLR